MYVCTYNGNCLSRLQLEVAGPMWPLGHNEDEGAGECASSHTKHESVRYGMCWGGWGYISLLCGMRGRIEGRSGVASVTKIASRMPLFSTYTWKSAYYNFSSEGEDAGGECASSQSPTQSMGVWDVGCVEGWGVHVAWEKGSKVSGVASCSHLYTRLIQN